MEISVSRLIFIIICLYIKSGFAGINFQSSTSTIKLSNNANLVAESALSGINGVISKSKDATISGEDLTFSSGTFEEDKVKINLDGILDTINSKLKLTGNKSFRGLQGQVLQTIDLSGKDNRLEGELIVQNPLTFLDKDTTVTVALTRRINQNIQLNGGQLFLEEDLHFIDGKRVVGPGTITLNKRKLIFGAEGLSLSETMTFIGANDIDLQGNLTITTTQVFSKQGQDYINTINGNGNIIIIEPTGVMEVDTDTTLVLKNLTIQGIRGDNVRCVDDTASIIFQKTDWVQSGNFYFQNGAFDVLDFANFHGPYTFNYQTSMTSTIDSFSRMGLKQNFRFSYSPNSHRQTLIELQDETSELELRGATLHISTTGMQLTKGIFKIREKNIIENDALTKNAGLIIGDGNSADNDLQVEIYPEAALSVSTGFFTYRNVD